MDDTTYTLEFEKPLRELEKQLITLQHVSDETKVDVSQEIKAIESKKEREQEVEKQKAELERFTTEQQQKVELAKAESEAAKEQALKVKSIHNLKIF